MHTFEQSLRKACLGIHFNMRTLWIAHIADEMFWNVCSIQSSEMSVGVKCASLCVYCFCRLVYSHQNAALTAKWNNTHQTSLFLSSSLFLLLSHSLVFLYDLAKTHCLWWRHYKLKEILQLLEINWTNFSVSSSVNPFHKFHDIWLW